MTSYCSWCNKEILNKPENSTEQELCLDCLLTFISGDRPDRRRLERRRYRAMPPEERRHQSDRRRR